MESGIEAADITDADGVIKQEHLPEGYPYKTVEEGYILEECQPMFSTQMGAFVVNESLHYVEVGKEYTVTWNGTEYNCVVKIITNAPPQYAHFIGLPAIGNFAVVGGENTGEPFAILCAPEELVATYGFAYGVIPLDGSTEITLSIKGGIPIYHPISEKYLINPTIKITVEVDQTFKVISCDKKFAQVFEKVYSGSDAMLYLISGSNQAVFIGRLSRITETVVGFAIQIASLSVEYFLHNDETWTSE
jgi:hypothetical protein